MRSNTLRRITHQIRLHRTEAAEVRPTLPDLELAKTAVLIA